MADRLDAHLTRVTHIVIILCVVGVCFSMQLSGHYVDVVGIESVTVSGQAPIVALTRLGQRSSSAMTA